MSVYEQSMLLRCKDANGNSYLLYPITQLDCVDGAEDLVHFDKEQELTAVQKAQVLKNIGGLCAPTSAQVNKFLKVSAVDADGNVTAVTAVEMTGSTPDTTSGFKMVVSDLLGSVEIDPNASELPLINLDFANYRSGETMIPNNGTLGSNGAATVTLNGGTASYNAGDNYDPGIVLTNKATFTVPMNNIATTINSVYTWIVGVSDYTLRDINYCRICRGNNDFPSVFYYRARGAFCAKLFANCTTASVLSYNPDIVSVHSDTGLTFQVTSGDTLAFTCDGSIMRFYINGVEAISMSSSKMSTSSVSTVGGGDTSNTSNYYMSNLRLSKFILYDRCLTAEELLEVN